MGKNTILYNIQQEALGSQVEALTKEKKKKKENVLTNLELVNLNNASMFNYEELKRRIIEVERKKLMEANKVY